MPPKPRYCKVCTREIPLGNGRESNYQQRVYCGPGCATLADKKRQSVRRHRLQSLVDEGWNIQVWRETQTIRGRASRGNESLRVQGGTAEIVLERLWKATQSSSHAGQSKAKGFSSSTI